MNNKFKEFINNNDELSKNYGIKIIIEKTNLINLLDKTKKENSIFVSPSNSFIRMEGGIDRMISREIFPGIDTKFWKLNRKLGILNNNYNDKNYEYFKNWSILPIGSSLFLEVFDDKSGVIVTPTMFSSYNVNHTHNAYISLLSSLLLFKKINEYKKSIKEKEFERIYITGHCCGNGGMSLEKSVNQFYKAFNDFKDNNVEYKELDYINIHKIPEHMFILLEYKEEEKKVEIDKNNIKTIKFENTNQIEDIKEN